MKLIESIKQVISEASKKQILMDKIGFNEDNANLLDTICGPLSVWMANKIVYTTSRRFKNKGLFYMVKMMIKSWFNRNNDEFFTKEHNYWT
jgi:hypothetical protein